MPKAEEQTEQQPLIDIAAPKLEEIPGYEQVKQAAIDYLPISDNYGWMLEVFVVFLMTAAFSFAAGWILRLLSKVISRTSSQWDDVFVEAMRAPLKSIIWILGCFYAVDVAYAGTLLSLGKVRDVAVILMMAWALIRYINAGIDTYIQRQKRLGKSYDYTALNAVSKLLKIVVMLSAGLITLQNLGVSVGGVLAAGGIGGIAIGFAAQDLLANFFGAFIIYFDKPFKVGDWIRSPDQNIEGTVEEIGWRMTTIRTFDKRPLYVPNSVFSKISVENPSRMSHRRIKEVVGIRYDDIGVMKMIVQDVKAMLHVHDEIDETQTLIVNFDVFNASSCDFLVYTFTKTTDWVKYHEVKQDVLLRIAEIIEKHGAEIAYPTHVEYSMVRHLDSATQEKAPRERNSEEAPA